MPCSKHSGLTVHVERWNNTPRQRLRALSGQQCHSRSGSDARNLSTIVHSSLQPIAAPHLTSPLPLSIIEIAWVLNNRWLQQRPVSLGTASL
jgi:hypothetical protein